MAVVIVDAMAWYDADATLLDHVAPDQPWAQLINRAAIYRLITSDRFAAIRGAEYAAATVHAHEPVVSLVERLTATRS